MTAEVPAPGFQSAGRTEAFALSVVIASWNGCSALARCLDSLGDDINAIDTEIIVVSNFIEGVGELLDAHYPRVLHIAMPHQTTVPMLRAVGMERAKGDIVALAEDHCLFGSAWCESMRRAHAAGHLVVGGAIENGEEARGLEWAVFLHDYGRFMLPAQARAVDSLAGNNVSYRREALQAIRGRFPNGVIEPFFHGELIRCGYPLFFDPGPVVFHATRYRLLPTLMKSFHLARSFAAQRVETRPGIERLAFAAASLSLPLLLPARAALIAFEKRRQRIPILRSAPCFLLLVNAWFLGELSGYLVGEGQSARHWR